MTHKKFFFFAAFGEVAFILKPPRPNILIRTRAAHINKQSFVDDGDDDDDATLTRSSSSNANNALTLHDENGNTFIRRVAHTGIGTYLPPSSSD